jgi:hypothetical protein
MIKRVFRALRNRFEQSISDPIKNGVWTVVWTIILGDFGSSKQPTDPMSTCRELQLTSLQNTPNISTPGVKKPGLILVDTFLDTFDGVAANTVFCFWTGTNKMTRQRILSLWSIFINTRCPIVFLNNTSIIEWELPKSPFHPALAFLSETHKSDYLRSYFMQHYGGGYTDIKLTSKSWSPCFSLLRNSNAFGLGYTELGPDAVAPVPGAVGDELRRHHADLIGLSAFIFRKETDLTKTWYARTCELLDNKYADLRVHQAQHPSDSNGLRLKNGTISAYPLTFTQLLGEILHPIIYEYRTRMLHHDIAPQFYGYH